MKNDYKICGDVTYIYLTSEKYGNMETVISTEDLLRVNELSGTWYADKKKNKHTFYVCGNTRTSDVKRKKVKLHRHILRVDDPVQQVDHTNHNTLDNTRSNLRKVTPSENAQNRRIYNHNKSGHTGVYWLNGSGKWRSYITLHGHKKHLGNFSCLDEAILARKAAERVYHTYMQSLSEEAE